MADQDTLSPEDSAALVHAQQQLYSAGDPRAEKLYNYIVKAGYATKGDNGELHPTGETKSFYDKYIGPTLSGNAPWQQAIDKAATPEPYSADKGVLGNVKTAITDLGAGAAGLASMAAHPLRTLDNAAVLPGPNGGVQRLSGYTPPPEQKPTWGQVGGEVTAALPALALAKAGEPVANTAAKAATSAIAETGAKVAEATKAATPKLFPEGPPESIMTKAVRPNKNNVGWSQDAPVAIGQMKAAEQQLGRPIQGIDDAIEATGIAKQNVWNQVKARMGPASQMGSTIDGNQIADAMVRSIDKRIATQNPALAQHIQEVADTYRRPMPVDEAEQFLQSNNQEMIGYYGKNKVSRQQAAADPTVAYKLAEGDALRDALYSKIDSMTGPGIAQLKKAYGSLSNMQKELVGRKMVYERQAPANLPTQLAYGPAIGKIATGNVIGGLKDIAVQRYFNELNDTNAQIGRAFQKAEPARPFLMPKWNPPQIAGLLPEQAGGKTPLLAPDPGMTPGERTAALMQELRRKPQLRLPAKANPLQLPSQFR